MRETAPVAPDDGRIHGDDNVEVDDDDDDAENADRGAEGGLDDDDEEIYDDGEEPDDEEEEDDGADEESDGVGVQAEEDELDPYRFLLEEDDKAPNLEEKAPNLLAGRIEILEKLAEGAMGEVWRGRHLKLGRLVAVKLLDDTLKLRADGRARFMREARALAELDHPNVVRVYDCDELSDGNLYLCMELLDGETLREVFQRGKPLGALEVVGIGRQVCDAVGAAHRQGILHRDLTPSNIMRQRDAARTIKVIDWGLCKYLDLAYMRSVPEPGTPPGSRLVTPLGTRFGTPEYLAPEMILRQNPRPPSFRTDVFSLAVVLYELLTGRHPFAPGERREPRPIREALRGFEYEELEVALRQAMHFEPEKRTQTMAEFSEALDLARERILAYRASDAVLHSSCIGDGEAAATSFTSARPEVATLSVATPNLDDSARAACLPVEQPRGFGQPRAAGSTTLYMLALVFIAGVGTGVLGLLVGQRLGAIPPTVVVVREARPPTPLPPVVSKDEAPRDLPEPHEPTSVAVVAERPTPVTESASASGPSVLATTVAKDEPRRRVRSPQPTLDRTFSTVMNQQQKKLRACASKAGVTAESVTVQVRHKGKMVDGVRVLKMTKEHPFSTCVDDVVRNAKPPPGTSPIEDFTFSAR